MLAIFVSIVSFEERCLVSFQVLSLSLPPLVLLTKQTQGLFPAVNISRAISTYFDLFSAIHSIVCSAWHLYTISHAISRAIRGP